MKELTELTEFQSGFRPMFSTETALLEVTNEWLWMMMMMMRAYDVLHDKSQSFHPYLAELERSGVPFSENVMKDILRREQLPCHDHKCESFRITQWWQIEEVFTLCTNFEPRSRPTAPTASEEQDEQVTEKPRLMQFI